MVMLCLVAVGIDLTCWMNMSRVLTCSCLVGGLGAPGGGGAVSRDGLCGCGRQVRSMDGPSGDDPERISGNKLHMV